MISGLTLKSMRTQEHSGGLGIIGLLLASSLPLLMGVTLSHGVPNSLDFHVTQLAVSVVHAIGVWNGVRLMRRAWGSVGITFAFAVVNWLIVSGVLSGVVSPLAYYEDHPRALWIMHCFLWFIFTMQLAVCLVAAYAQRVERRERKAF